jgi:L-asparagine transporter-like permease
VKNIILFFVCSLVLLSVLFPISLLAKNQDSQTVTIAATVDCTITGAVKNNVVYAETNWERGLWLIKNDNSFVVLGRF